MNNLHIILTTGGTGGHIFPALAVAEALKTLHPQVRITFMGSEHGPERALATEAGLCFVGFDVQGVLGRGIKAVKSLMHMGKAVMAARAYLQKDPAQLVVGFGAYASAPALCAARLLKIPYALHEQNAVPGMVNRLLGPKAAQVFLSLPDMENRFGKHNIRVTGNPIRTAIAALADGSKTPSTTRHLLVMGGSQGAKAINSIILGGIERLATAQVEVWQQSGPSDYKRVLAGYTGHHVDASRVTAFIEDMPTAYQWADLVLCRSGASTVAELAAVGLPSILVPFPHATHDHQSANAMVLAKAKGAVLVHEKDLSHNDVIGQIIELMDKPLLRQEMGEKAKTCANVHAATQVAARILELAKNA